VSRDITKALADWLVRGGERIGQIAIAHVHEGWELRHVDDAGRKELTLSRKEDAARWIANLDATGKFRPLKTTPDLVRGWRLVLPEAAAVRRALDFFYPAMLGVWFSHQHRELTPVVLRDTLGRQTGMYRVTQNITDPEARKLIDGFCAGCLKHRLWEIASLNSQPPVFAKDSLPLLCHEACNLLVAKAREAVKGAMSKE
jgi:sirohydrochlorin cobaltochelatase